MIVNSIFILNSKNKLKCICTWGAFTFEYATALISMLHYGVTRQMSFLFSPPYLCYTLRGNVEIIGFGRRLVPFSRQKTVLKQNRFENKNLFYYVFLTLLSDNFDGFLPSPEIKIYVSYVTRILDFHAKRGLNNKMFELFQHIGSKDNIHNKG